MVREGSWYDTAERNVGLVELAVNILAQKRPATLEEQQQLAAFVGFGAGAIRNDLFPVLPSWMDGLDDPGSILKPNGVRKFHELKHQFQNKAKGAAESKRWGDLAERLAALPEDWQRSILRSTQYAHYTSPAVVSSIWRGLKRLGFQGGRILEPGAGKGNFPLLMPEDLYQASIYTGVEFDGPTAEIARLLLPQQVIKHADYTNPRASRGGFAAPRDFYDAAVGNPPFSKTKITSDPEYAKLGLAMHDFFFAKTLDRVKPGGLMVFVTSRYTMDKANDVGRRYLAERADLIGAIRMPQTAFRDNAGTDVVTDVLFLRKRHEGEAPAGAAWGALRDVESRAKDGTVEGKVKVNEYFADHPEMVLGQIRIGGTGAVDDMGRRINALHPGELVVVSYDEPSALEGLFDKAVERLPENVYSVIANSPNLAEQTARVDFDPKAKREGVLYRNDDGEVMRVQFGVGVPVTDLANLKPAEQEWLKSYVGLRDAVQEARFAQLEDGEWEAGLKALNEIGRAHV